MRTEEFCMYNWGSAVANTQHYGQTTPPNWSLSTLVPPTMIFYGGLDTVHLTATIRAGLIVHSWPTPPMYKQSSTPYRHLSTLTSSLITATATLCGARTHPCASTPPSSRCLTQCISKTSSKMGSEANFCLGRAVVHWARLR